MILSSAEFRQLRANKQKIQGAGEAKLKGTLKLCNPIMAPDCLSIVQMHVQINILKPLSRANTILHKPIKFWLEPLQLYTSQSNSGSSQFLLEPTMARAKFMRKLSTNQSDFGSSKF